MDIDIGSRSEDGLGALALYREFAKCPEDIFPKTHTHVADRIEILSLRNPNAQASVVARRAAELITRELRCSKRLGLLKSKPKERIVWDWMSELAKMAGLFGAFDILKGQMS